MNYDQAKQYRDGLESAVITASDALRQFPKLPSGLVSDEVRAGFDYQTAQSRYDTAFRELRDFNSRFTKVFAKEIRRERRQLTTTT